MFKKFAMNISLWNRKRKYSYFVNEVFFDEKSTLLDVGFENINNKNSNMIEKVYPYRNVITALGIYKENEINDFKHLHPDVNTVLYDGVFFPFTESQFDVCWSNAVIEHVGDVDKQIYFIKEMVRVSNVVFFTTPNRFFPVETHTKLIFLHWFPKKKFDEIVCKYFKSLSWATGDYMYLLSKKDVIFLLKKAGVHNYIIKSNRFLGFTMDYCILINK